MSKVFVAHGDTMSFTAPRALASGEGFLVGATFAVAQSAAANGAAVGGKLNGVHTLTTLGTDVAAVGALAYWDNTNFRVTTTVGANTKIGVFYAAKANGPAVSQVRLNGSF